MHLASNYAETLLNALPAEGCEPPTRCSEHPVWTWARSGAMALAGRADEAPRVAPAPLATCARAALDALRALAPKSRLALERGELASALDGAALLGERAAYLGLLRRGSISPGGSCRLLRAADSWIAVSLPRADDRALIPAWLEQDGNEEPRLDPWDLVAAHVAKRRTVEVVMRARLLGLAVAAAGPPSGVAPPWFRVTARGANRAARLKRCQPLVLDLSALWAGPLCGRLLGLAGARVVKVECVGRPDGARYGSAGFYEALNTEKESVCLDLHTPRGVGSLQSLLQHADIVIENARPRAFAQLGIDAERLAGEGLVWVSITGYGRREPEAHWTAYGDDAAAASGLATATGDPDAPLFCGDAIADPLAGIHAAVAALAHWRSGEGALLELALRDVTAHCLGLGGKGPDARVEVRDSGFEVVDGGARVRVASPRAALPVGRARPLGADTASVLGEFHIGC
ncbi:MAG TPA: CoA transferase [Myxococcota bacterium]|nr:CoA transferase [Myxococcota bacterium]